MVSRRNYITITIMLLLLFFMFQFTGVMKNQLNQYDVNEYEMNAQTTLDAQSAFDAKATPSADTPSVFCVGSDKENFKDVVYWWCTYSKRAYVSFPTLEDCTYKESEKPGMIVLDGRLVDDNAADAIVQKWADDGIHLVFAKMPGNAHLRASSQLKKLLGISRVLQEKVTLTGTHLFEGFLLGGEEIYEPKDAEEETLRQDMNLTIPWYVTGSGTKTYMTGLISDAVYNENITQSLRSMYATLDENSLKNMLLPAVIWRNGLENASVFCVNGDFLSDISGAGVLEAMVSEANSYDIYPVVNAQNFVVANFPAFVSENETTLRQLYSQPAEAVYKEIIWPAIAALNTRTNMKMTCMLTPQFDYEDAIEPDGSNVAYYLKLLKEDHGEAGLSGTSLSHMKAKEKLSKDESFWKQYAKDYAFQSLYLSDSTQKAALSGDDTRMLRTLDVKETGATAPIVSYDESGLTEQRVTSTGVTHTYMDDFKLKSMETALAYSNITLDLYNATYPELDEDSWQNLMKKISANVATFWKDYQSLEQTTLSESDLRIRRFLALDYTQERKEDTIYVSVDHFEDQAWFLLRLNGEEADSVKGGTCVQIEDGVYLLEAQQEYVSIHVKQQDELHYHRTNEQLGGGS